MNSCLFVNRYVDKRITAALLYALTVYFNTRCSVPYQNYTHSRVDGLTENDGLSKLQDMKLRDKKYA